MEIYLQAFWADEDGAVTVDWVILTAVVVALALLLLSIIQAGALTTILEMWATAG